MTQSSWKPVRLSADEKEGAKADKSSSAVVVDLVIFNEAVKKIFRDILDARPEFRVKDLKETAVPRLVILELDEDPTESFAFIESIVQAVDGREVFLTSPRTDSLVLLEALRAGAKEFFPQPIQTQEVETALTKFLTRSKEPVKELKKVGEIYSVFGGKGGVGTTSVAVNLALSLKTIAPKASVVLVEANQQGGDVSLFLDVQTSHGLRDLAADLSRLDVALLTRMLSKHSSGLRILPSGFDDLSAGRLSPDSLEPIMKLLQTLFDYVVVDCGHVLDLSAKKLFDLSSKILVVSVLLVPVVQRTKRVMDLLRSSGINPEKLCFVVNRYASDEKEILAETQTAMKFKAAWVIPNDYPLASQAINSGLPVIHSAPRSALAKKYHDIGSTLCSLPNAGKSGSTWIDRLKGVMGSRGKPTAAHVS